MRVIVSGRLRQRSYETKEGEKRTVVELDVEEIGPSLKYATAKVTKVNRASNSGGGGGWGGDSQQGSGWDGGSSGRGQQGGRGSDGGRNAGGGNDAWTSGGNRGGWGGGQHDEDPPF